MELLILRKKSVSSTTQHYTMNLAHLPLSDDVELPWLVVQLYTEQDRSYWKIWRESLEESCKAHGLDCDIRRLIHFMLLKTGKDRMRVSISDEGVLTATLNDGAVISDLEIVKQIVEIDEAI